MNRKRTDVSDKTAKGGGPLLNRRELLVGTGVTTAVYAGGISAAEPPPQIWTVWLEPDSDWPGRSLINVAFPLEGSLRKITLRETAFGERARARIEQIPLRQKGKFPAKIKDYRLTISGMELAREGNTPGFFELIFELRHEGILVDENSENTFTTSKPTADILASGWVFGSKPLILKPSLTPQMLFDGDALTVDKSAKLADAIRQSIFGKRLPAPRDGSSLALSLLMPSDRRDALRWRLSVKQGAAASGGLAILTCPMDSNAKPDRIERAQLLWGDTVEVWREVPSPTGKKSAADRSMNLVVPTVNATCRPLAENGSEDVVRTIGELIGLGPTAGSDDQRRVVIAEKILDKGVASSVLLRRHSPSKSAALLTRIDRSGRNCDPVVTAIAEVSGQLYVSTLRSKQSPREEGPFNIEKGQIILSGPPDGSTLHCSALLPLSGVSSDVSTAHGSLVLCSPEQKSASPGQPSGPAPVRIAAHDWTLDAFELTGRVFSAAVALKEPEKVRLGFEGTREHGLDLAFPDGVEVLFRIHGLAGQAATRPGIGRVTLGWLAEVAPAAGTYGTRFMMPMEGGVLTVLRWRDLAKMKYRFVGVDLTHEDDGPCLRPRGLARAQGVTGAEPGSMQDPRPMMVVELPPQHVAEEAFFEQRKARPALPGYPLAAFDKPQANGTDVRPQIREAFSYLRQTYLTNQFPSDKDRRAKEAEAASQRVTQRQALIGFIAGLPEDVKKHDKLVTDFTGFSDKFKAKVDGADSSFVISSEQKLYVGPEFLDPSTRLLAEMAAADPASAAAADALLDSAPEDPVGSAQFRTQEFEALKENASRKNPKDPDPDATAEEQAKKLRSVRDPFYTAFKDKYQQNAASQGLAPGLATYFGRAWLRENIKTINADQLKNVAKFVASVSTDTLKYLGLTGNEEPTSVSRARLSGCTRLAFRLNTDDFEKPGGAIPLSIDELTNWSRHELAVVRRAEKTMKTYDDGSLRPAWDRAEDLDLSHQLVHQGFSRGGWRGADGKSSPQPWPTAVVSAKQRLSEVAASARVPPSPFETSIELPFRLHLSPAQDGRFRTRRPIEDWVLSEPADGVNASPAAEPLWTAELDTGPGTQVRAVWSPDFRAEAFLPQESNTGFFWQPRPARLNRAPIRGPYAPWELGHDVSDAKDICALIHQGGRISTFRTSLDASDRHELVALTSLHGLPVMGKVKPETGNRVGIDQREPPPGFQVATGGWPTVPFFGDGPKDPWDLNDVYVPRPLDPAGLELALSSLGGFLRVNASFEPPASILDGQGNPFFDALSIEKWRHRIVLGRDISAEVVYKGYLFPIGMRCALVKVTERRFQKVTGRSGPVAVLRQHMFLRVSNPDKAFPAYRHPDVGRRVPFTALKLITTVTPDIVDPYDQGKEADADGILPSGLVDLGSLRGVAFWPRTARRRGSEVKFDLTIDGSVPIRMPLIFVDNVAANNQVTVKAICDHYNNLGGFGGSTQSLGLVEVDIHGAKLTYAPQKEAGDTQFETVSLTFGAEGRQQPDRKRPDAADYVPLQQNTLFASDAFMQGADQPPFYPAMRRAKIKLGQIERLTAQAMSPVDVAYDPTYAINGFDETAYDHLHGNNPNEVFLSVLRESPKFSFGAAGDRGGAVGRQELNVMATSRTLGAIGAESADGAKKPEFSKDPSNDQPVQVGDWVKKLQQVQKASQFLDSKSTILGLVTLSEIVKFALGVDFEPKVRELTEFAGGLAGDADQQVRERVLIPLLTALASFETSLKQMSVGEASAQKALDNIYPAVAAAKVGFQKALQAAVDAPPVSDGPAASLSAYTAVYTSGRAFVSALDRVVRDPVTPVREAGRKIIDDASAKILGNFEQQVRPLVAKQVLDPLALRKAARDVLVKYVIGPLKALVFSLPLPGGSVVFGNVDEADVSKAISDAMDSALDDDAAWGVANVEAPFFNERVFWDRVSEHLKNAAAGTLQDRLNAEAKSIAEAADTTSQADALHGYLWPHVKTVLDSIGNATTALGQSSTKGLLEALEAVDVIGSAIGAAQGKIQQLAEIGKAFAKDAAFYCQNMLGGLDDFVHMILPIDDLPSLDACVVKPNPNCRIWDVTQEGPFALAAALSRFWIARQSVWATDTGKLAVLERKLEAFNDTAHGDLAQPVAALNNALTTLDSKLMAASKGFVDAVTGLDRGVHAYREFSKKIGSSCASPNELGVNLTLALRSLQQLNKDRLAVVENMRAMLGPLYDFILDPSLVTALTTVPSPKSPTKLTPYGDPAMWQWADADLNAPEDASQAVDAARKCVVGIVLPIVQSVTRMFEATSSAGVPVKTPPALLPALGFADPRATRKAAFALKLAALQTAAAQSRSAGAGRLKAWLDQAYAAVTDQTSNSVVTKISNDLATAIKNIDDGAAVVGPMLSSPETPLSNALKSFESIRAALSNSGLQDVGKSIAERLIGEAETDALQVLDPLGEKEAFERRVLAFLAQGAANIDELYKGLVEDVASAAGAPLGDAADQLAGAFEKAVEVRNSVAGSIHDLFKTLPRAVASGIEQRVVTSLYANPDIPPFSGNGLPTLPADALSKQAGMLRTNSTILKGTGDAKQAAAENLFALVKSWNNTAARYDASGLGPNPLPSILRNVAQTLGDLVKEALQSVVASIVDFGAVKEEIERNLKGLIPAKITLAYDLDTEIQGDAAKIFVPELGSRLTLKSRTVIDLLHPGSPQVSSSGELGPFKIGLIGDLFDIVTLSFDGAKFGSDTGGKFKTNIVDVQLGEMVSFLQAVSSFLSFSMNGFYLRALFDPPGIEAGYEMPPMGFALGVIGLSNLSLTASCILPFDGTPAMLKVGLSTPEMPFLINVGVYGGGGYLGLYASPQGIIGFEASFEFGAVVAFNVGPLSGTGRVTTGIFLRSFKDPDSGHTLSTIEGLVSAGGQASLSIFRFAALLQIRIGQQPGGALVGTAIFTFSFSMGIRDIKFRITTKKQWGKGFHGSANVAMLEPDLASPVMLAANGTDGAAAAATAAALHEAECRAWKARQLVEPPISKAEPGQPQLVSAAVCKGKSYKTYRTYFSNVKPWTPEVWL